jgi:hypothetical protein
MLNAGEYLEELAVRALGSDGRDRKPSSKSSPASQEYQSGLDDDLRATRFHFDLGGT